MDGCVVRADHGHDFSIWAHALKLFPELDQARTLFFVNDRFRRHVDDAVRKLHDSNADFIAATDSPKKPYHYQANFLAYKHQNETFAKMKPYWDHVQSIPHEDTAVARYGWAFPQYLEEVGIVSEVLFPTFTWRKLAKAGVVKKTV